MGYRVLADELDEDARSSAEEHYSTALLVCSLSGSVGEAREWLDMLGIDLEAVSRVRATLKDSAA